MKPIDTNTPFVAVAESRIGGRSENQDTCAWQNTCHGMLLLVCDGMGGGPSGKMASQMAADAIVNFILDSKPDADRRELLAEAIRFANRTLISAQDADHRLRGMGTTVTALLINDESAVIAHVGDSRIYQLRGTHKVYRTFDHSHVFELVKAKVLSEEEARLSGESNIITRALGPMENVEPEVGELPYEKGDRFMLCSDGIWGALPEKEILKIAGGTKSLAGAVESLAIKVDETGRSHGATHDNLTLAILQTPFNSKLKYKMSTRTKYVIYILAGICCLSLLTNFIQYRSHSKHGDRFVDEIKTTEVVGVDSVVTRAELDKILAEERDNYLDRVQAQDKYYSEKIDELYKALADKGNNSAKEEPKSNNAVSGITEEVQIVQEINTLIRQVEEIGKIKKRGESLDKAVTTASKEMDALVVKVKKMNIKDQEFEKCVNLKWINAGRIKEVDNSTRSGHIKAIVKALESLKNKIQSKSGK